MTTIYRGARDGESSNIISVLKKVPLHEQHLELQQEYPNLKSNESERISNEARKPSRKVRFFNRVQMRVIRDYCTSEDVEAEKLWLTDIDYERIRSQLHYVVEMLNQGGESVQNHLPGFCARGLGAYNNIPYKTFLKLINPLTLSFFQNVEPKVVFNGARYIGARLTRQSFGSKIGNGKRGGLMTVGWRLSMPMSPNQPTRTLTRWGSEMKPSLAKRWLNGLPIRRQATRRTLPTSSSRFCLSLLLRGRMIRVSFPGKQLDIHKMFHHEFVPFEIAQSLRQRVHL